MFPEEGRWSLSCPLASLTMNAELTFNITKSNRSKKNFQIGHRDSDGSRATGAKNGTDVSKDKSRVTPYSKQS